MVINVTPSTRSSLGFSLLELVVVVVIVALLITFGFRSYLNQIDHSKSQTTRFQAATFLRMIQNLHAYGQSTKFKFVAMPDKTIFFNELGYPANTSSDLSPSIKNQSDVECEQLWRAFFNTIEETKEHKNLADIKIRSIDGSFCRYDLHPSQTGVYFFDYYFKTGSVLLGPLKES